MKQCVYTRLQFNKCTKISHSCNFTFYHVACCVFLASCQPWVLIREFQAQCNLIAADVFDQNRKFFANFEYFLWIFNTSPGHL